MSMSLPKTETRPIPVMTILFLGSFSRLGAETVGEAMALILPHFAAKNKQFIQTTNIDTIVQREK